jgi:ERCC4-type nuclease
MGCSKEIKMKTLHNIFSEKKQRIKKEIPKEKIIIDYREKNSLVAANLTKLGFEIEFKELKVGDYIVKDVVIERKTVSDFRISMINQRLLRQIQELKQYENKLLIIEGIDEKELYPENNKIAPNAIRGFLLSIALKHKIPIIFSKNSEDTAKFIAVISKKKSKEIPLNGKKKTLDKKEQMQLILESFLGIGPKNAKKLLQKFSKLQNIFSAPQEELKKIIGKKAEIFILLEKDYSSKLTSEKKELQ